MNTGPPKGKDVTWSLPQEVNQPSRSPVSGSHFPPVTFLQWIFIQNDPSQLPFSLNNTVAFLNLLDLSMAFFFFFCLYWICYNISSTLCFLDFRPHGMWDCSFLTRGRTSTPCLGRQSLNHWTTREGPLSMAFTIVCLSQIAIPLLFLKKHIFAGKVTFIFKVNTNFICFMKRYI